MGIYAAETGILGHPKLFNITLHYSLVIMAFRKMFFWGGPHLCTFCESNICQHVNVKK